MNRGDRSAHVSFKEIRENRVDSFAPRGIDKVARVDHLGGSFESLRVAQIKPRLRRAFAHIAHVLASLAPRDLKLVDVGVYKEGRKRGRMP